MRAYELSDQGARRAIDPGRALGAAQSGRPILLEGALIHFGLQTVFEDEFFEEVERLTSPEGLRWLRNVGLQRMHDVLDPDQVAAMLARLDRRMKRHCVDLARAVARATTAAPTPHYFICARTFVRAQIPLRLLESRPHLLSAGHLAGHLRPVAAHRDVDLTHPRGSLSIWCAVGPVREGNTIALFFDGSSQPVTPALFPGDVLVFNADALHASVPNRTDETRIGVGTRMKLGRWLQYGPGTHWRPWYDASLLDTPLEPLATLQSRLTPAALRRWRWRRTWSRAQRTAARP